MKDRKSHSWFAFLVAFILLFPACTAEETPPEPTDTLVIYGTDAVNELDWGPALNAFRQLYPDVTIDYREFSVDNFQEYYDLLRTELAAGKGPDLIVTSALNSPVSLLKAVDSGAFADINPFIESDANFSLSNYHQSAMEAGVYNEKRLFIPLSYSTQPVITTEENLEALGIDWDSSMSFWDVFEQADSNTADLFFNDGRWYELFMPWSGVSLATFQNKELHVETEEFQQLMEAYKKVYSPLADYPDSVNGFRAIQNHSAYFVPSRDLSSTAFIISALSAEATPIIMPVNADDPIGKIDLLAWINQGSENKVNAYNMLKILLGESIQGDLYNMPVLLSQVNMAIEKQVLKFQNRYDEYYEVYLEELSEEQITQIKELFINVTFDQNYDFKLTQKVMSHMDPYFRGADDYQSCLNNLKNELTLFMNE